jgi:protein subunit release factor B
MGDPRTPGCAAGTVISRVNQDFHAKQNKTSSAVQLKHLPTGVVVKSQATRSREQNRKIARDLLAAKLDAMRNGDQSRAAIVGEVKRKKSASASKKSRRKYRKLEEEKAEGTTEEGKAANATEDRDSGSK